MWYNHEVKERRKFKQLKAAYIPKVDESLWDEMKTYLKGRELSYDVAVQNGWFPSTDAGDYESRIVMPAINPPGLAYWQARSMERGSKKRYQSPPVPRGQSVIQVWPTNKEHLPVLILTEGPMDALAIAEQGYRAIAIMGARPTDDTIAHIRLLAEDVEKVVYIADRDAMKETKEFCMACIRQGLFLILADPYPYKDFAATPKRTRKEILQNILQSLGHVHAAKKQAKKEVDHSS